MAGPAAVKTVTLVISVGAEGNGVYVLGKGSAFGTDRAPGPTSCPAEADAGALDADAVEAGVGAGAGAGAGGWAACDDVHAAANTRSAPVSLCIAGADLVL